MQLEKPTGDVKLNLARQVSKNISNNWKIEKELELKNNKGDVIKNEELETFFSNSLETAVLLRLQ